MSRPDRGMTRRNVFVPDELWKELEQYAADLSQREGKPVSVAEALRRILERSLSKRR